MKSENIFQYRLKNELTPKEQQVADFYDEHPKCSRLECCKEVYGGSNVFQLKNLSSIECSLRKKGYLFYTVDGHIIDMARGDVEVELKLKVQNKIGKGMIGNLKSNLRIFQVANHDKQIQLLKNHFKEAVLVLAENKIININALKQFKVEKGQLKLKSSIK